VYSNTTNKIHLSRYIKTLQCDSASYNVNQGNAFFKSKFNFNFHDIFYMYMLRAQGLIFWKATVINTYVYMYDSEPGSSVGIATDYELDGPGSNPGGDEIFRPSRPVLGPTHPPVQRVPRFSPGVKCGRGVLLTTHPLLVPRSWKCRAIPLPTLWATPGL